MADLDAELLALAGGDSSGDEDYKPISSDPKENLITSIPNNTASTTEPGANMANKPSITLNGAASRSMKKGRNTEAEEGEA